jgi:hypothetical protein
VSLTFTVNGVSSGGSTSAYSGDWVKVACTGAAAGSPVVELFSSFTQRAFGPTGTPTFVGQINLGNTIPGGPFVAPGAWVVRLRYAGSGTILASVNLTVLSPILQPFPSLLGAAGTNLLMANVDIVASGANQLYQSSTASIVKGTVTIGISRYVNSSGPPHPTNITMQYILFGPGQPTTGTLINGQVFDAGGFPTTTLDTTTLSDGTYMVGCQCIDSADTTSFHWAAYNIRSFPTNMVVMNTGPKSPVGTYVLPTASLNGNSHCESTGVDFVTYTGISGEPVQPNSPVPYPDIGFQPPVYSTSSPFNPAMGGTPSSTRTMAYWGPSQAAIRYLEYKESVLFGTTTVGGVMVQPWSSEATNTSESIEGSYPPAATQSYRDGPRLNGQTTGNSNIVATPDVGPFAWWVFSIIRLDGNLSVVDPLGNTLTVAGNRADPTLLQLDKVGQLPVTPPNPEWPNTIQVGTISPAG